MLATAPIIEAVSGCSSSYVLASLTFTLQLTLSHPLRSELPPSKSVHVGPLFQHCHHLFCWVQSCLFISHRFAPVSAKDMAASVDGDQGEQCAHLIFAL